MYKVISFVINFRDEAFFSSSMRMELSIKVSTFILSASGMCWQDGQGRKANPSRLAIGSNTSGGGRRRRPYCCILFTFALSGPLPPKEMGVILGVAVCSTPSWSGCCWCR